MVEPKRRLPLLQDRGGVSGPSGGDETAKTPQQWRFFGALFMLSAWIVGASLAERVRGPWIRAWLGPLPTPEAARRAFEGLGGGAQAVFWAVQSLLSLGPLVLSTWAGGYVLGRFAGSTKPRDAMVSAGALVSVFVVWLLIRTGPEPTTLVGGAVSAGLAMVSAYGGAARGFKRRDGKPLPPFPEP